MGYSPSVLVHRHPFISQPGFSDAQPAACGCAYCTHWAGSMSLMKGTRCSLQSPGSASKHAAITILIIDLSSALLRKSRRIGFLNFCNDGASCRRQSQNDALHLLFRRSARLTTGGQTEVAAPTRVKNWPANTLLHGISQACVFLSQSGDYRVFGGPNHFSQGVLVASETTDWRWPPTTFLRGRLWQLCLWAGVKSDGQTSSAQGLRRRRQCE